MNQIVPKSELKNRMSNFRKHMDSIYPEWEIAILFTNISLYYFTGTMQNGMLVIQKDGDEILWVYRSYERAVDESQFDNIKNMKSYREAAQYYGTLPNEVYIEMDHIPIGFFNRIKSYFSFEKALSLENVLSEVRAVKSEYELELIYKAGDIHRQILEDYVPTVLREGMSEAELGVLIYSKMMELGHHGISRFQMFDTEMLLGNVGFGTSSIYPTYFDGPGGNLGLSAAVPLFGNRERKLKKGDLVFIDMGCGVDGYHTDKTMVYSFGRPQEKWVLDYHMECVSIQNQIVKKLKPGAICSQIYKEIMDNLDEKFLEHFMGFGNRRVNFLGHSIGLCIDEFPVIARGFDKPIAANMVFALEPKRGIPDVGMVGIENTFVVKETGAISVTGTNPGMIIVD